MFPVRQRHAKRLLCNILAYTSKVLDFYRTRKTLKRSKRQVEKLKNVSNVVLDEDLPSSMDTSSKCSHFFTDIDAKIKHHRTRKNLVSIADILFCYFLICVLLKMHTGY